MNQRGSTLSTLIERVKEEKRVRNGGGEWWPERLAADLGLGTIDSLQDLGFRI